MSVGQNSKICPTSPPNRKVNPTNRKSILKPQSEETALDIKTLRKLSIQLVEAEERGRHIRNLLANGVGFREEEEFLRKERTNVRHTVSRNCFIK